VESAAADKVWKAVRIKYGDSELKKGVCMPSDCKAAGGSTVLACIFIFMLEWIHGVDATIYHAIDIRCTDNCSL